MDILESLKNDLHIAVDINMPVKTRKYALDRLWEYGSGLEKITDYDRAVLQSMQDEIGRPEESAEVLRHLAEELKKLLYLPMDGQHVCIFVGGQNWISHAMRDLLAKRNYICIPEDRVNWKYADSYERAIFLICEESRWESRKEALADAARMLRTDILLQTEFLNTPALRKVVYEFESACTKKDGVCLVLGLSYGRDAIHCDLLEESALTLANSGQDLYNDFLCLKYAQRKMPHLRYVINVIAPYSLRYDESMSAHADKENLFYYSLFGELHHNIKIRREAERYSAEKCKADSLWGQWKEISDEIWRDYYWPMYGQEYFSRTDVFQPEKTGRAELETSMEQLNRKPYPKTLEENKQLLKDYCSYAKEQGLKVLFLIPPYSRCYRELWREEYYLELLTFLEELQEFNCVEYMDLSQMDFSDNCFRDIGHLNRIGAIRTASCVNEWIKRISVY